MKHDNFKITELSDGMWSASADILEPRAYHIEFKGENREDIINKLIDYLNEN